MEDEASAGLEENQDRAAAMAGFVPRSFPPGLSVCPCVRTGPVPGEAAERSEGQLCSESDPASSARSLPAACPACSLLLSKNVGRTPRRSLAEGQRALQR